MCDAKDDANSLTRHWSIMGIKSVKNFDLVTNISHKRKGDGIDSRGGRGWWLKQVTTVRVDRRRGGEGVVGSRTEDEKERVTVNSLISGVTFGEIMLSG